MKEKLKKTLLKFPTYKIQPVARYSLNRCLSRQFKKLKPGRVLDIGAKHSPYRALIPHLEYLRLDIAPESKPDILGSVEDIKWEDNYFDTVIATELLEHIAYPERAVQEIHRVLKPEGIVIISTRFIFPYHPGPKDYYRFTKDSLALLFKNFKKIEIYPQGNRVQASWDLLAQGAPGIVLNLFNPLIALINFPDSKCVCGFVVWAEK